MNYHHNKIIFLVATLIMLPASALAKIPNDPEVKHWAFEDTGAYKAWDKAQGSQNVVVAVVDSGFDTFHPDLKNNVWKNENEIPDNGIDDDKNGYIDDVWGWDFSPKDFNGDQIFTKIESAGNNDPRPDVRNLKKIKDEIHHATLVAGIIGAEGNNGRDAAGINWQVKLMNLKAVNVDILNEQGPLVEAIHYAVDNGADIINISLVGNREKEIQDVIKYAYDNGVAVVAAAGNTRVALNTNPLDPVCADSGQSKNWVLGVSAIGEDHFLSDFSNTGRNCIDITAPGENIQSALRYAPRHGLKKSYGGKFQGTSFAAPFVSGALALIKSIQPSWGPDRLFEAVIKTVHRTPPKDVQAYENYYGAGLLQIDKAVDYALKHVAATRPLKEVLTVDTQHGTIWTHTLGTKNSRVRVEPAVKSVDRVVVSNDGFVTYRKVNPSLGEVAIYDKSWMMLNHWTLNAAQDQNIVVGDILGDGEEEIILAPATPKSQVLRIYSMSGELIDSYSIKERHKGVSLGLIRGSTERQEILVLMDKGEGTKLHHLNNKFELVRSMNVDFVRTLGSVGAGDIDGDGLQEYVVGAGKGDQPFMIYFDDDGSLLRKFFAYGSGYIDGFPIVIGDYDSDGKDDIIEGRRDGNEEIRVWNRRSKKINTWNPGQAVHVILPIYR